MFPPFRSLSLYFALPFSLLTQFPISLSSPISPFFSLSRFCFYVSYLYHDVLLLTLQAFCAIAHSICTNSSHYCHHEPLNYCASCLHCYVLSSPLQEALFKARRRDSHFDWIPFENLTLNKNSEAFCRCSVLVLRKLNRGGGYLC
ncbi:hypothetical protein VNO78_05022 [Psophocarpus tetragonolobus]|uniref:Uncharacterized protein n=1 Tax=Psophocarpus tetragonolobus TaxID=3891 RepID=A0AAN9SSF5_PSOTE